LQSVPPLAAPDGSRSSARLAFVSGRSWQLSATVSQYLVVMSKLPPLFMQS